MGLPAGRGKSQTTQDKDHEEEKTASLELTKGKKFSRFGGGRQEEEHSEDSTGDSPAMSDDESSKKEETYKKMSTQTTKWPRRRRKDNESLSGSEGNKHAEEDAGDDHSEEEEESKKGPKIMCEVIPDHENNFHRAIQNHDWDELDTLLKDYDHKVYAKPKSKTKPKKTGGRQLKIIKYIPEKMPWQKEKEVPINPLCGLDALGRAPLHLCCIHPVPTKLLLRLLFVARDVASVPDGTGSLPIHLAIQHERSEEVIDKLIRGYYPGSWQPDGKGRTPLMWAIEVARRRQLEENRPPTKSFWGSPLLDEEREWQHAQGRIWGTVRFLLENRDARRKKLFPPEHRQIIQTLGKAAPPEVISLFLKTGAKGLSNQDVAGTALSLCISRHYPLVVLEKLIEECPVGFPKLYKDSTGRGIVAAHYRLGCVRHNDFGNRRESFRMNMQQMANAENYLDEKFDAPEAFLSWFDKLKYLINLWGTHNANESDDGIDHDELLLHNALSNSDVPPSLVQLIADLFPASIEVEHPKSRALPIHLACRVWRYRHFPPRTGEKGESKMDKVVAQLLEGQDFRTRKSYRGRLPLQHAIAAAKSWSFIKPLVVQDLQSLHVRDPITNLYPFQLAACRSEVSFNMEMLTKNQFTRTEWNKLADYQQDNEVRKVMHFYDLEQLTVIFEILKHSPGAIDHESLVREEATRRASGPQRLKIDEGLEPSDQVINSMQMKMVRGMFGLGNVSGHFIAWSYERTRRGWKTHRTNFAVIKDAIMDGFVPIKMDGWWRKLKFWIWQDCLWDNIPRRDDFLLHGALCNPETSPWIIELLLEVFPRSSSIPLPESEGCYPLHIACVTDRYIQLPFEFSNKRTTLELIARAFPEAMMLKWKSKLPLNLAVAHSKEWDEIEFLAENEPVTLAIRDPDTKLFPFQLMALNRSYTTEQKMQFENIAKNEVGKNEWKAASAQERVTYLSKVLEKHETAILEGVWELLKLNPALVSIGLLEVEGNECKERDSGFDLDLKVERTSSKHSSDRKINAESHMSLSMASRSFLGEVYAREREDPIGEVLSAVDSSLAPIPENPGLYSFRRKDILLVTEEAAYVVWKTEVLSPDVMKICSNNKDWRSSLQSLGDEIDFADLYKKRQEREQQFVSSIIVDGRTVFLDEDDVYVWILVGEEAVSFVENYDIEVAKAVTSCLLDGETGVWFDPFEEPRASHEGLCSRDDSRQILDCLLGSVESGVGCTISPRKKFVITRSMLRHAFGYGTYKTSPDIADLIIEQSSRKLAFEVSKLKLDARLQKIKRTKIRYQVARDSRFERYRNQFCRKQKESKIFKRLKKKQRHAMRRSEPDPDRKSSDVLVESFSESLTMSGVFGSLAKTTSSPMNKTGTSLKKNSRRSSPPPPAPRPPRKIRARPLPPAPRPTRKMRPRPTHLPPNEGSRPISAELVKRNSIHRMKARRLPEVPTTDDAGASTPSD